MSKIKFNDIVDKTNSSDTIQETESVYENGEWVSYKNEKKQDALLSNDPNFLFRMGQNYYDMNDFDKAEEFWEKARQKGHSDARKCLEALFKNELKHKYDTHNNVPYAAVHKTCSGNDSSYTWASGHINGKRHTQK